MSHPTLNLTRSLTLTQLAILHALNLLLLAHGPSNGVCWAPGDGEGEKSHTDHQHLGCST